MRRALPVRAGGGALCALGVHWRVSTKPERTSINVWRGDLERFKKFRVARNGDRGIHVPNEEAFKDLLDDWFDEPARKPRAKRRA